MNTKNKSYVICHMYSSIDGKIDGLYMEEDGCNISGEYYDDKIFKSVTSMASGRVTTSMYKAKAKEVNMNDYSEELSKEDYIIENKHYNFIFDRMGKCFYNTPTYSYGGKTMQIVEVVSTRCNKRYLTYLKAIKVSYIIADSIKDALSKIYQEFKVERLMLTGGATINGGFLKENLIDEISIIVAPFVEGNDEYKTSFAKMNEFINQKYVFKKANPLNDGGVELIFKKED